MPGRLAALWEYVTDYLRASLWFIPALLILGAVGLAYVTLAFHPSIANAVEREVWWFHSGSGRDAAALLQTLLSSMISMTALVVSITVVVLSLAANQLGPRLIRNFVSNRRTQVSLGIFIATITYLLLVLRSIEGTMPTQQVPHLAVTLGSLLSLVCIGVLLFLVHHLARSIVADTVIRRVGDDLNEVLDDLATADDERGPNTPRPGADTAVLRLGRGGYVQMIDFDSLVRCAAGAKATIILGFRPGDLMVPKEPLLWVSPASALTEQLASDIDQCVILGDQRTAPQDMEFGLRQLVEIGLRALSSGLNDAFTVIAVIDRLALVLAQVMDRPPLKKEYRDRQGITRIHANPPDFGDLLETAYNQIIQSAAGKADVLLRVLSALRKLTCHARHRDHGEPLRKQAAKIVGQARRSVADPADLAAIENCHHAILTALDRLIPPDSALPRGPRS